MKGGRNKGKMRIKRGVKHIIKNFSFVKFSVLVLFILVTASVMVVPKIKAEEEISKSFYMMSSAAASYMSLSQEPKSPGATSLKNLSMGDAGALLSYVDTDTPGWSGFSLPTISAAAVSKTYKSLLDTSTGDGTHTNSLYYYARYGYLLESTGLDSTGGTADGFIRTISGAPLWLIYQLAQAVPTIFSIILNVLRTLNVFNLFAVGFNKATSGVMYQNDSEDQGIIDHNGTLMKMDDAQSAYVGAGEAVSGTYRAAYQWGWEIVMPLALLGLCAGILIFRENGAKRFSRIKRIFLRAIFITFGVPICGALYSAALDWVSNAVGDGMENTGSVVTSTLCDFEGWVEDSRLAVPKNAVLVSQGSDGTLAGEPSGDTYANLRATCYAINSLSGLSPGLTDSNEINWDGATITTTDAVDTTRQDMGKIVTLIERYMHGDTYEAASFESSTKAWLSSQTSSDDDYASVVEEMMENSLETTQFCGDTDEEIDANTAEEDAKEAAKNRFEDSCSWNNAGSSNISANIWNNGGLQAKTNNKTLGTTAESKRLSKTTKLSDKTMDLTNSNSKIIYSSSYDDSGGKGSNVNSVGGLSTVAMYNYLNSEFSKSEVKIYSVKRSTSLFTKPSHYSVNLIGNGVLAFLYWLNAMVILLSIVVLGYWYALSILFSSFKVSMEIIFNVPFMAMGILKSGVKVLVFTMVLIIELVGTMFLYTVVTDIIFSIGGIVNNAASIQLGNTILFGGGGVYGNMSATFSGTLILTVIKILLSTIIIVLLTIKALQIRKGLIKGMNEMMQQALERLLLDGDNTGAMNDLGKPSAMGSLAKGIAKGAGMAKGMAKGGEKSPQKGPQAAVDGQMLANALNARGDDDGQIDLDEKDRLAQEDREGLPGPTDGKNGEDGEERKGLPGPTGDSGSDAGNRLPGPTDGKDSTLVGPAMAGSGSESKDKEIANKLKNVASLGDVDKSEDKEENKETKPVSAAEEDKESKEKGVKGHGEDSGSEKNKEQNDGSDPNGEKSAYPNEESESSNKGVQAVSPDMDGSNEQSSTDGENGENTSSTKEIKEHEVEQRDKNSADSKDGNKGSQDGQPNRGKPSENTDGKTEKGRIFSENSSSKRPKDIKGYAESNNNGRGASTSMDGDNISQKQDGTLKKVHTAAKEMIKDNSYKQSRLKSGMNIDKNAARQDGIVYSRTSKSYVDANNAGKSVHAFKDVDKCFNEMKAQGKGRTTELNGCSARIKGNDMIITKKMANGGKTQFTVDRDTGIVKEQRYNLSFMEQRYKKDKKKKK